MKILDAAKLSQVRGGVEHGLSDAAKSVWDPAKEHAAPLAQAAVPHATPQPSAAPSHGGSSGGSSPPSPLAPEKPLDVGAQTVAQQAKAAGKSDKEVEEMMTFYHLSNAPGWAKNVAKSKTDGKSFEELGRAKINPDLGLNDRKKDPAYGRGGDDLGPGFYTTTSKAFVDDYMDKNYKDNPNDAGVMSFQMKKKEYEAMNRQEFGKDDDAAFQQNMKDGFYTYDVAAKKAVAPKLDTDKPAADVMAGPINDIMGKTSGRKIEDGQEHTTGTRIQYDDGEVPLQYAFRTQQAVQQLYGKSNAINYTSAADWSKQREAEKAVK